MHKLCHKETIKRLIDKELSYQLLHLNLPQSFEIEIIVPPYRQLNELKRWVLCPGRPSYSVSEEEGHSSLPVPN